MAGWLARRDATQGSTSRRRTTPAQATRARIVDSESQRAELLVGSYDNITHLKPILRQEICCPEFLRGSFRVTRIRNDLHDDLVPRHLQVGFLCRT